MHCITSSCSGEAWSIQPWRDLLHGGRLPAAWKTPSKTRETESGVRRLRTKCAKVAGRLPLPVCDQLAPIRGADWTLSVIVLTWRPRDQTRAKRGLQVRQIARLIHLQSAARAGVAAS